MLFKVIFPFSLGFRVFFPGDKCSCVLENDHNWSDPRYFSVPESTTMLAKSLTRTPLPRSHSGRWWIVAHRYGNGAKSGEVHRSPSVWPCKAARHSVPYRKLVGMTQCNLGGRGEDSSCDGFWDIVMALHRFNIEHCINAARVTSSIATRATHAKYVCTHKQFG